jgi:penicillin-insensitive murein endopeptidase
MIRLLSLCCAVALAASAAEAQLPSNPWSRVAEPSPGAAQSIGGFARGCIAGAVELPPEGPGYEVVHLSRRRFFGHPETLGYVERLAARAQASGLPGLLIGDMAQPRGGPLPYGHASHQTGLDVDIWFTPAPKPPLLPAARETVSLPSMLLPNWRAVNAKRFGNFQVSLLRLAATDPLVERIFVNPVIKASLCRTLPPRDHTWLGRLRPWFGHDDHFHVRLRCPADSPRCEAQQPVPPGDGCDSVLASWVRGQRPPPPAVPPAPRKMPLLPAECRAVLDAP